MSFGSGADAEYRSLLARAGVDPEDAQGYDAPLLEQLAKKRNENESRVNVKQLYDNVNSPQIFNVMAEFGAVGDGVTNDAPAFQAARSAAIAVGGGIIYFPYTSTGYLINAAVPFATNVHVQGERYVKLKRGGTSTAIWLNAPSGVSDAGISGFTIDDGGISTSYALRAATGSSNISFSDNHFVDTGATQHTPINVQTGTSDISICKNRFTDIYKDIVRVDGGSVNLHIEDNKISGWKERCFYIIGTAVASCENVYIKNNEIFNLVTGGSVRQPITVQGVDSSLHLNVNIIGNTVKGPGLSYNDAVLSGSADQISIHRTKGFKILFNTTTDGGDTGITVAMQCTNGIVGFNTCLRNDTVGICIGSGTTLTLTHVNVIGNNCFDNGQSRTVVRPYKTGIHFNHAQNCSVWGNLTGNNEGTTQQYGMSFVDASSISVGPNGYMGNVTGSHQFSGVNSNIGASFNGSPPVTKPTVAVDLTAIHTALVNAGLIS